MLIPGSTKNLKRDKMFKYTIIDIEKKTVFAVVPDSAFDIVCNLLGRVWNRTFILHSCHLQSSSVEARCRFR